MIKIKLSDIVQPGRPADVGQLERAIVAACNAEKEKGKGKRTEAGKMIYVVIYVHDTAAAPYAVQIVNGLKTIETRSRDTLRRFIGSRVLVARTRSGHAAEIIGAVNIDRGAFCSAAMLDSMRALTRIPAGSAYDCRGPGKYCYSLSRPAALKNPVKLSGLHIVKRSRVYAIIDTDRAIIPE